MIEGRSEKDQAVNVSFVQTALLTPLPVGLTGHLFPVPLHSCSDCSQV